MQIFRGKFREPTNSSNLWRDAGKSPTMDYCAVAIVVAHLHSGEGSCASRCVCVWDMHLTAARNGLKLLLLTLLRSCCPQLSSHPLYYTTNAIFCVSLLRSSILLHARHILRAPFLSLLHHHSVSLPCRALPCLPACRTSTSDTFAAKFGHRVDRITTTRWRCSRCSSSCRCWCSYSPTPASPSPCGASGLPVRQRTRGTNAWRAPSAR